MVFAAMLLSVLFAPFWLTAILGMGAIIYFPKFWEGTLLFFLSDLLYGTREPKMYNVLFVSFIVSIIILIVAEFIKTKLKFYPNKQY